MAATMPRNELHQASLVSPREARPRAVGGKHDDSSPYRRAALLNAIGLGGGAAVIWLVCFHLPFPPPVNAMIASLLLGLAMQPPVYFLMLRPLKLHMAQLASKTQDLERANSMLEERVSERTRELEHATRKAQDSLHSLEGSHRHSSLVRELVELLEASNSAAEAREMMQRYGHVLFPGVKGALYVYHSSRNFLELGAAWGAETTSPPTFSDTMNPDDCWALRRGRQHDTDRHTCNPRCRHFAGVADDCATLCLPMVALGELIGVVVLFTDFTPGRTAPTISEDTRYSMAAAVEQISLALSNLQLREKLSSQAIRDPLTGMFNRRYFEETVERELRQANRKGAQAGVIMIDLDHFKRLNDTRGHDAGDAVLRRVGLLLQDCVRIEDIACRYGGEEFVLFLPDISIDQLVSRADQIREAVRDMQVRFHGDILQPISLSCGVAISPEHGTSHADLLESADRALYLAKKGGRDRVVVAE